MPLNQTKRMWKSPGIKGFFSFDFVFKMPREEENSVELKKKLELRKYDGGELPEAVTWEYAKNDEIGEIT